MEPKKPSYIPENLPLQTLDYARLIKLVGEANGELARFDGLLHGIVNPELLLSPLTTNEAVLSSRIEGTQATLNDILQFDAGIPGEDSHRDDIQEVVNFVFFTATSGRSAHFTRFPA